MSLIVTTTLDFWIFALSKQINILPQKSHQADVQSNHILI
jgi:hypothetical protein